MTNENRPGFCAVVGHDVSEASVDRLYEAGRAFLTADFERALNYYEPGQGGERGYTPFKETYTDGEGRAVHVEVKESISFGHQVGAHPGLPQRLRSVMPDRLVPGFTDAAMAVYRPTHALFVHEIGLLEEYFDGSLGILNEVGEEDGTMMRVIMYAAKERLEADPKRRAYLDRCFPNWRASPLRSGEHIDSSLITNLVRATSEGLQFLDRQGRWITIRTDRLPKNAMLANGGKTGGRLTGGLMRPRPHRVIRVGEDRDRLSAPCFGWPNPTAIIKPSEACLARGGRPYDPMPAWQILKTDLADYGML